MSPEGTEALRDWLADLLLASADFCDADPLAARRPAVPGRPASLFLAGMALAYRRAAHLVRLYRRDPFFGNTAPSGAMLDDPDLRQGGTCGIACTCHGLSTGSGKGVQS